MFYIAIFALTFFGYIISVLGSVENLLPHNILDYFLPPPPVDF